MAAREDEEAVSASRLDRPCRLDQFTRDLLAVAVEHADPVRIGRDLLDAREALAPLAERGEDRDYDAMVALIASTRETRLRAGLSGSRYFAAGVVYQSVFSTASRLSLASPNSIRVFSL